MSRYHGIESHVGHTLLIRLRRLSELTGCEILGNAEFMNPGGSVKDRAALGIITDAEAKGWLKPGATIIEGTAGNTGINLAGAVRFAQERGPGQTIVTLLCDSGLKYQSKIFNPAWLEDHHLNPNLPIESILT